MKRLVLVLVLLAITSCMLTVDDIKGASHAVIIATSYTFSNYRHQSDALHAYKLLIQNGISHDNIILIIYDDIADNKNNPFKGKVFNKPDPNGPGVDVYAGAKIDYKGKHVSSKVFIDVITGNKAGVFGKGSGRVLNSGPNDNVFIYMTDHGAPGLVAFLDNDFLYADVLLKAIQQNYDKKLYKKLVFYLEACESGSMFASLPSNINVYATTAANDSESSYAIYCSPDSIINGKNIGSCLGDEYSVLWLEDSDKKTPNETLADQYTIVRKETLGSHVQQFGDLSISKQLLSDFIGKSDSLSLSNKNDSLLEIYKQNRVSSRDVKLRYLYEQLYISEDIQAARLELEQELELIKVTDEYFRSFIIALNIDMNARPDITDYECLRNTLEAYKNCMDFKEYTLKYVRAVYNACAVESQIKVAYTVLSLCWK